MRSGHTISQSITLPFLPPCKRACWVCSLGSAAACIHRPSQIWHQVHPPALDSGRLVRPPKRFQCTLYYCALIPLASCHLCLCVKFPWVGCAGYFAQLSWTSYVGGVSITSTRRCFTIGITHGLSTVRSLLVLRSVLRANVCHRGVISNTCYYTLPRHTTTQVLSCGGSGSAASKSPTSF